MVPIGSTVQIECYSLNPAIWIRHADEASDSRVLALGVRPIDTAVDLLKYGFMQQVSLNFCLTFFLFCNVYKLS